jgi:nickel-dependent lactate racemase
MDEKGIISILDRRDVRFDILSCPGECPLEEGPSIIKRAFSEHFRDRGLSDLMEGLSKIGIVVNDRNRPTPTHLILEHLLNHEPWIIDRISCVVVATGSHKEPTESDMGTILGRAYSSLIEKVHIHRSRNREEHIPYGKTSRGTELYFDRALEDCDFLMLINSVEPHYFAGFTGGRKSIIPGIALFDTIEANHKFALDPGSRTTGLEGNPVHEDMVEACSIYLRDKRHLSFQIVQAPGVQITGLRIGDVFSSFEVAVSDAKKRFCAPITGPYDLVIALARPPMDRTLYQAQKAIEHGKLALKEGGVMILVAECSEGIGQSTFWDLLTSSHDRDSVMSRIEKGYKLGYHKAARIVQLADQSDIFMVSRIPSSTLEKGFITGFADLEKALDRALDKVGSDPKVLFIPDGTVTVPLVPGGKI